MPSRVKSSWRPVTSDTPTHSLLSQGTLHVSHAVLATPLKTLGCLQTKSLCAHHPLCLEFSFSYLFRYAPSVVLAGLKLRKICLSYLLSPGWLKVCSSGSFPYNLQPGVLSDLISVSPHGSHCSCVHCSCPSHTCGLVCLLSPLAPF